MQIYTLLPATLPATALYLQNILTHHGNNNIQVKKPGEEKR